jgi:asparagine synthase (glutamine-hydrolysing)
MSGIFGCWNLDERPLDIDTFRACLERISPARVMSSLSWHDGPVGLGYKTNWTAGTPPRPHICARNVVCVFDGRLDNRDELLSAIPSDDSLDGATTDCDLVRMAYQAFGDDVADRLQGDFTCAVFDAPRKRLLLARDRLGIRPLCFTEVNNTLLFASDAKALLAWPGVNATPDDLMMADFVLQFLSLDSQNRTFFRDIHSVPPAHVLLVTRRELRLQRYFDFNTRRRIRVASVREYVDHFDQLMTAAVRNRLRHPAPVAVSVSGGLDSAYIFSIAARLVRDGAAPCPGVLGFNYSGAPGTPSDEEQFVRAIEQSCRTTIERIPQRPGFMQFAADETWHSELPLGEALPCQRQAMLRRISDAGARRLLTGHWGDQMLFDTDYLVDLWRSRQWNLLRQHSKAWGINRRRLALRVARDLISRHFPATLLGATRRIRRRTDGAWRAPWYTKRFRGILRERFEERRLTRVPGSSHARAIYQQARHGYHVRCMEWNARVAAMHGLEIAFPYLDSDLVQFLMSMPGEIQSHDGVPRGLMRKAMRGLVPDVVVDRRSKGEFTQLANRSLELDFPAIETILGPSSLAVQCGYLDGSALWPLLADWKKALAEAENATVANRLLDLCGMELLLREFTSPDRASELCEPQMSVAEC